MMPDKRSISAYLPTFSQTMIESGEGQFSGKGTAWSLARGLAIESA
jgi:hypothetical protein